MKLSMYITGSPFQWDGTLRRCLCLSIPLMLRAAVICVWKIIEDVAGHAARRLLPINISPASLANVCFPQQCRSLQIDLVG